MGTSPLRQHIALLVTSGMVVGATVGYVLAFLVCQVAIFARPGLSDHQLRSIFAFAFASFVLMGLYVGIVESVNIVRRQKEQRIVGPESYRGA